jgi:hypothetical protein
MRPSNKFRRVTVFRGSSELTARPIITHILPPQEVSRTLCGVDLLSKNSWFRQTNPYKDKNVPACNRCLNSAIGKYRKVKGF